MKFTVFMAKNPNFGMGRPAVFPVEYTKIATVNCDNLDDAFRVTNTIESAWWMNPEVAETFFGPDSKGYRSFSVGDVMVNEEGQAFRCEMAGWKELEGNWIGWTK